MVNMNYNAILVIGIAFLPFCNCQQKVPLSSVKTLTLYSGRFTTARRGSPIPQLRCIASTLPCIMAPSTVQCYNKGSDGLDIQWRCEAQLRKSIQFDTLQVSCEGYDYPTDPYILAGSCGLTYSLKPSGISTHHHTHHRVIVHRVNSHHVTHFVPIVSGILLLIVLVGIAVLAYRICACYPSASMGEVDTPPSYYCRTQYKPLGCVESNSGPGFWTGAAVGGAAGYLIGSGAAAAAVSPAPSYHTVDACEVTYVSESSDDDGVITGAGYASTWRR